MGAIGAGSKTEGNLQAWPKVWSVKRKMCNDLKQHIPRLSRSGTSCVIITTTRPARAAAQLPRLQH